jgi:hypothetical protein
MRLETRGEELMQAAPYVYAAAVAAARDETAAGAIVQDVLRSAVRQAGVLDRAKLVESAIRLGVRSDPAERFASMEPGDREAVALARLAGYTVAEVAATLGTGTADVKARMLRGLRTLQTAAAA